MRKLLLAAMIVAAGCAPSHEYVNTTACNATPGYTGPERCGDWRKLSNAELQHGPHWLWSFDAGHGGATDFVASNP